MPARPTTGVLFFASDTSTFCSGQTLYMHGGPGPAGIGRSGLHMFVDDLMTSGTGALRAGGPRVGSLAGRGRRWGAMPARAGTKALKSDAEVRARYDLSSLQVAIHAAAPCPVEIKRQMLDWWGLIIHECYSGSEGAGFCAVGPEEWLERPGTVGKALMGTPHIVG